MGDFGLIPRRTFQKYSVTLLTGCTLNTMPDHNDEAESKPRLRFGMVTDIHYADRETKGTLENLEGLTTVY
jgi:hypothetical protein